MLVVAGKPQTSYVTQAQPIVKAEQRKGEQIGGRRVLCNYYSYVAKATSGLVGAKCHKLTLFGAAGQQNVGEQLAC